MHLFGDTVQSEMSFVQNNFRPTVKRRNDWFAYKFETYFLNNNAPNGSCGLKEFVGLGKRYEF